MQTLAVQTPTQPQTVMIAPTATPSHRFIQNQVICQQNPNGGFQGETLAHTHAIRTHTLFLICTAVCFSVLQPQVQSIMTSPQVQPMTIQHQRLLTPTGQTIQTLSTTPVHTVSQQVPVRHTHARSLQTGIAVFYDVMSDPLIGRQVLVHQPQILKTDSLVLTTLKPDGTQVLSTVQNPQGITTLTAPIQTTALQVPVRHCIR